MYTARFWALFLALFILGLLASVNIAAKIQFLLSL